MLYRSSVYYSTTVRIYIANKAAQKIYNKLVVQVVAKYKVRHPRAGSNCHDSAARGLRLTESILADYTGAL